MWYQDGHKEAGICKCDGDSIIEWAIEPVQVILICIREMICQPEIRLYMYAHTFDVDSIDSKQYAHIIVVFQNS